jgi:Contractile injection system tube protein
MTSPRLIKGGLVQVDVKSGRTLRTIALQYNPESLSRTVQVQAAGESGGDTSQALRIKGAAAETIKVEAEIDATDRLEHPGQNRTAAELGIHPDLAALELLVQPTSEALQGNDSMARSGTLEVLPLEAPLLLFVWGPNRVVPVRITDLSITEDAFDANLNPIRATVSLGMRVLTVDDLGFAHRGGQLFMAHLRSRGVKEL